MGLFDINHYNQLANNLPVNKRTLKRFWWLVVLLKPAIWLYYTFFKVFKEGVEPPIWVSGTYTRDSVVRYAYKTYISLIDGNTDVPTTSNWLELQDNHLGVDARVLFKANKLVLEYALNKYFDGTWCECKPIEAGYIYITTNEIETGFFRVGFASDKSSSVGFERSSEPIGYAPSAIGTQYAFTVNVQEDLWNDLAPTDDERENIMRNFIDRYNIAGLFYNFVTYAGTPC